MAKASRSAQQSLGFKEDVPEAATLSSKEAAQLAGVSQRVLQRAIQHQPSPGWYKDRHGYYRTDPACFATWLEQYQQSHQLVPAREQPVPAGSAPQVAELCEQVRRLAQEILRLQQRLDRMEEMRELVRLVRRQLEIAHERERALLRLLHGRARSGPAAPHRSRPLSRHTIGYRIRDFLQREARPRRIWQIAQALQLSSNAVRRELARLVEHEEITRLKPGLFMSGTAPVVPGPASVEAPVLRPPTVLERIVEAVQEAGFPLRPMEIQQRLGLPRSLSQELTTLVRREALQRDAGRYSLPATGDGDAANTRTEEEEEDIPAEMSGSL